MNFPYGRAPLAILFLAAIAATGIALSTGASGVRPDLIFAIFADVHVEAYTPAMAEFDRQNQVHSQLQLVNQQALKERLQAAMQAGAEVPDMVEILDGTLGTFTQGPLKDVELTDLTDRVRAEGLNTRLVTSRFGKWSSRGRIFALPHDVHPVMLCYRRDLCDQLGIDVKKLTTWDTFAEKGREVTAASRGPDGVPQHYMIDLQADGSDNLRLLFIQAGGTFFDAKGGVAFDSEAAARAIAWYVHQNGGAGRIAFSCGWGQNLAKAMNDGLCLFYITPDWRTKGFQQEVPGLSGKLGLMPMPAWDAGGRRTTTWGGTGLAFPKAGKHFDLAWKLAMKLYYDPPSLGERFEKNNILPPLKAAWTLPQFSAPRPFFGGIRLGQAYAALADQVPEEQSNAFSDLARDKLSEAFANAADHYEKHGDAGLDAEIRRQLTFRADDVRKFMSHNVFLSGKREGAQ